MNEMMCWEDLASKSVDVDTKWWHKEDHTLDRAAFWWVVKKRTIAQGGGGGNETI
jgi:hypothetical protein